MARPQKNLVLTPEQRSELEAALRARSTDHLVALRVRIVLRWADGERPEATAGALGAALRTVNEWRRRFERGGFDALHDRQRSGRRRIMTPEKADQILEATVHKIPHEGTHWSTRLMAKHARVSRRQVMNVWKAADLRPHRLKTFKISRDPKFVVKHVISWACV